MMMMVMCTPEHSLHFTHNPQRSAPLRERAPARVAGVSRPLPTSLLDYPPTYVAPPCRRRRVRGCCGAAPAQRDQEVRRGACAQGLGFEGLGFRGCMPWLGACAQRDQEAPHPLIACPPPPCPPHAHNLRAASSWASRRLPRPCPASSRSWRRTAATTPRRSSSSCRRVAARWPSFAVIHALASPLPSGGVYIRMLVHVRALPDVAPAS